MSALPIPNKESLLRSQALCEMIQTRIINNNGWITFAEFMHMALYTPSIGYYSGGSQKFAETAKGGGDFITAPALTPVFAQTLAHQVAQILQVSQGSVLELGAGTGQLAGDILIVLNDIEQLPKQYCILEVSDHLRAVQKENLKEKLTPVLFEHVVWLDTLPKGFKGLILGNEVLDAIPVHLIAKNNDTIFERGVSFDKDFQWQDRPLHEMSSESGHLIDFVSQLDISNDYLTEVNPTACGLIRSLANALDQGAILMLDYGFSAQEYYHPQRNQGTLMCHFKHYAHTNPLINIGLQDITAHVDFTAIAEAGVSEGLTLHGYCNQANFLINCGILKLLEKAPADDIAHYLPMSSVVQKLLSPAEMGELFKVIALTKNLDMPLMGFSSGDKSHTL